MNIPAVTTSCSPECLAVSAGDGPAPTEALDSQAVLRTDDVAQDPVHLLPEGWPPIGAGDRRDPRSCLDKLCALLIGELSQRLVVAVAEVEVAEAERGVRGVHPLHLEPLAHLCRKTDSCSCLKDPSRRCSTHCLFKCHELFGYVEMVLLEWYKRLREYRIRKNKD